MRRRLDLAASMIAPHRCCSSTSRPRLDRAVATRYGTRRALVTDGTTVLLTTQYLEEADQLADRIR